MSHWNYRVMAKKVGSEIEYAIYEVYYDDNGTPTGHTSNPTSPSSYHNEHDDPLKSLNWTLNAMKGALKKPVLDFDNFPNLYNRYYRKRKLYTINKIKRKKK